MQPSSSIADVTRDNAPAVTPWRRVLLIALAGLAALALAAWLGGLMIMSSFGWDQAHGRGRLDEAQATAVFREHRSDCEALRRLLQDFGITNSFAQPLWPQ